VEPLVPARPDFEARVPEELRRYAGIGPYYLPVFGWVYARRLRQCLEAVNRNVESPRRILDAGCGFGLATAALARMFPAAKVTGLDIYPEDILRHARNLAPGAERVEFLSGSVEEIPFEDDELDVVALSTCSNM
jgi:ubiquinone/menaquinone biosynthesis C-methylase UbiE